MSNKTKSDPMNVLKTVIMRPNSNSCHFNKKHIKNDHSKQYVSLIKKENSTSSGTKIPLKICSNQNGKKSDKILNQRSIHCTKSTEFDTTVSLSDQIHALNIKLFSCLNKNHTLKREINFAMAVAKREIDDYSNHFEDIEKRIDAGDWVGRKEMIIDLRNKLKDLNEVIEERDRVSDFKTWKSQKCSLDSIPKGDRSYWMLQLERDKILRTRKREKIVLLEERKKQEEKLSRAMKSARFLFSELQNLRDKLPHVPAKSNNILNKQMHEITIRIRHCLYSKTQLLKTLTEEEALTRQYSKEITELKNQVNNHKDTCRDLEDQLSCLRSEHENNRLKLEEEQETKKYFDQNCNVLEDLKNGFQQQKKRYVAIAHKTKIQDSLDFTNPSDSTDFRVGEMENEDNKDSNLKSFLRSTVSLSKIDDSREVSVQNSSKTNKSDINLKTNNEEHRNITMDEVSRLKSSYKNADEYIANNLTIIYHHFDQIRDNTRQILENKTLLSKLSEDIQLMKLKIKFFCRIPQSTSTHNNNESLSDWTFSNLIESGELFLNALKKEEEFLKNSFGLLFLDTEQVNNFYLTGLNKTEDLFTTNLDKLKIELHSSSTFTDEINDFL